MVAYLDYWMVDQWVEMMAQYLADQMVAMMALKKVFSMVALMVHYWVKYLVVTKDDWKVDSQAKMQVDNLVNQMAEQWVGMKERKKVDSMDIARV